MLITEVIVSVNTSTDLTSLNISKAKKIICFMEQLSNKKFSGWMKINFHEGNLSNKVEYGCYENLE